MRGPGEVLLVSCYELGRQPQGVAVPAAFLRRAGFDPAALDLAVEPLDAARVARARLVAVSVPMLTALRLGVRAAERVRALKPDAHICFHGLYAALNARHLLGRHADSVLAAECEEDLVRLAQQLESGAAVQVQAVAPLVKLRPPPPARDLLPPPSRYAHLEHPEGARAAGAVEATRGCLHTCAHCPVTPVYRGRFFAVPRETVLADVAQQVGAGVTHITFADPDFLNGPRHALAIAEELHRRWPHVTFDATVKVEHLLKHRALLPRLRDAGCLFIVSAFESVNDAVLDALKKGHSAADLPAALALVREAGIEPRPTFVAFSPWETLESRLRLFDFVEGHGLMRSVDAVQFALRLLIPPGSPLSEPSPARPWLGPLNPAAFGHHWAHPDPRMERLSHDASALVRRVRRDGGPAAEPSALFAALRDQTRVAAGLPRSQAEVVRYDGPPPPALSESWYC